MLAVYVFCSLVVLASTDTVEVKFVPATLPNSCDVDRYDNILYQSNILEEPFWYQVSNKRLLKEATCVEECYRYKDHTCQSVSYYFEDGIYRCTFHGTTIIDGRANEADFQQADNATFYHIHGCGKFLLLVPETKTILISKPIFTMLRASSLSSRLADVPCPLIIYRVLQKSCPLFEL